MLRTVYGRSSLVGVTHEKPLTTSQTDIQLFSTFCKPIYFPEFEVNSTRTSRTL